MKRAVLKATLMAAVVGVTGGEALAADYRKNPARRFSTGQRKTC